jgi:hypothetical protein
VGFQDFRDLKSGESLNPVNHGSDGILLSFLLVTKLPLGNALAW